MKERNDIYPTRGSEEMIIERKDPILYGYRHMPCGLNDEQLVRYRDRGFTIIPDAFSKSEIRALNTEFRSLAKKHRSRPANGRNLFDLHRTNLVIQKLAEDKRIANKVKQILGSDTYLMQSQINVATQKTGNSYPWHSQFERWHADFSIPRMRSVEAWVILTDNTVKSGSMCMLDRSHQLFVACRKAGGPSTETLTRLLGFGGVTNAYESAGTLILCDSNLMCGTTDSHQDAPRVIAMLSYNSTENLPHAEWIPDFMPRPIPVPVVPPRRPQVGTTAVHREPAERIHA